MPPLQLVSLNSICMPNDLELTTIREDTRVALVVSVSKALKHPVYLLGLFW
jgi:hypothetical protein